ncbi:AvrD family protein [Saccharothrix saharensis]|uniref:AvrD family protein n=1 Tax=Saccharothrix saharensis TaxID=571190 RepID=UPI0036B7EF7C
MTSNAGGALLLGSVDDHLGPGATRFFGSGYRRVDYAVSGTRLLGATDGLAAAVEIRYPADWSRKTDDAELRPHLSTIDVLILAVRAAELLTARRNGLDLAGRTRTWLRRVDIKAPAKPVEGNLLSLPVTAGHVAAEPAADTRLVSTVDVKVAAMRVRVQLEHDEGFPDRHPADLDAGFGADYPGLYGGGFRAWRQTVADVVVDVPAARATAAVLVEPPDDPSAHTGVDAAAGPVVSMVDSFVVALQLGQVLLYTTDDMDRASSDTLWMRHTTITACPPAGRRAGEWFPAAAELVDPALLETPNGVWRTATIVGDSLGVVTRCSVAHRLPRSR